MFTDSHTHIDTDAFDADRADVLRRAREAGVTTLLVIGTGDAASRSLERAVSLAEAHRKVTDYAPRIFASVGIHPHDASTYTAATKDKLKTLTASSRVVAIGEIGLDYHYDFAPRQVQQNVFAAQLAFAKQRELPVIIHTREADSDTYDVIKSEYGLTPRGGVMHCFGGTADFAEQMINLNFMISFAGIVTFRKSEVLRQLAAALPLERLLIETDAPYLAPVPFRGKRNEPAYVVETAKVLAAARHTSLEQIADVTTNNFNRFFQITTT